MTNELSRRQETLLAANLTWLQQAVDVLHSIPDDATYARPPRGLEPHRAGGHLRHILEFYECFLNGVESGHIDYDARARDETVERSRAAAAAHAQSIMWRLRTVPALRGDAVIWVRMEDSATSGLQDPFLTSSIGRELQALSSHTIHHFALLAMTLRAAGIAVDADFGMAPSTLRRRATHRAAEAA